MNISMFCYTLPTVPKQYLVFHLILQPSMVLLQEMLRKTRPMPTTLFKIQTGDGLKTTLLNYRAWAGWLFGPHCKLLSLFRIKCFKSIFPSVGVTFTVTCHLTQLTVVIAMENKKHKDKSFNWRDSNGVWQLSFHAIVRPSWIWALWKGESSLELQIHYPLWLRRTSLLGTIASSGSKSCSVIRLQSISYLRLYHGFPLPHPNHSWQPFLTAFDDGG